MKKCYYALLFSCQSYFTLSEGAITLTLPNFVFLVGKYQGRQKNSNGSVKKIIVGKLLYCIHKHGNLWDQDFSK